MVNLETAVTDGTCPEPQSKPYIFDAPASALTALKAASISLATEANDHGEDCGPQGLSQNLTVAAQAKYPIIGIGNNAAQAFTPYRITLNGQRIAVIAATQVIASNLVAGWTATSTQPGVASAIDPTELVREVQQVRKTADTVIVYVHWGTETQACPNPQQGPLAQQLVKAGADIVIGSNAHVLLGAGYMGSAYVDYGLGNFAFYDDTAPETDSGSLIITAVGRHITGVAFRPATILNGLPQPLTGAPAQTALQSWNSARTCTGLAATPTTSVATMQTRIGAVRGAGGHHDHDDPARRWCHDDDCVRRWRHQRHDRQHREHRLRVGIGDDHHDRSAHDDNLADGQRRRLGRPTRTGERPPRAAPGRPGPRS